VSTKEALELAKNAGLDLVEIAATAQPPVCEIINYSKFLYQEEQKSKANRASRTDVKEIRLRPRIEEHDVKTKTNQIIKFLSQGHKVKVSLQFKGREISRPELGNKVIQDLINALTPYAELQAPPAKDGRGIYLTLLPKKSS